MKKHLTILITALLFAASAFAQLNVPQGINFQSVVHDNLGAPMANTAIDVRFTIIKGAAKVEYTEEHFNVMTDDFGLFTVIIGEGAPIPATATLEDVEWEDGNDHSLKVEVDATGTGYVDLGTNKFYTVPYAFHAGTADSLVGYKQIWTCHANGTDIFYDKGNVGIGSVNPSARLQIGGGGQAFSQALATNQKDLISLYNNRLDQSSMTGLGFETGTFINGAGQVKPERILYNKAEGGYRWYLRDNADGGTSARMAMNRSGDLGIGTGSPDAPLHLSSTKNITSNSNGSFLIGETSGFYMTMDRNDIQVRNSFATGPGSANLTLQRRGGDLVVGSSNSGLVGIGTNLPQVRLHIWNGDDASLSSGGYIQMGKGGGKNLALDNNEIMARNGGAASDLILNGEGGDIGMGLTNPNASLHNRGNNVRFDHSDGARALVLDTDAASGGAELRVYNDQGNQSIIMMGSEVAGQGAEMRLRRADGNNTIIMDADLNNGGMISVDKEDGTPSIELLGVEVPGQGAEVRLRKADGTASIILDAEHAGNGRIITDELEITGGSDFAENFDLITDELSVTPQAGMIVSIDPNSTGKLTVTSEAYDRKVAGIISGANGIRPGMIMGQKETIANGEYPIALSGRVYVWADASNGTIQPGDMLTSSTTPGYAMKATDRDRAQGAIIGKAMTSLESGTGYVLVLVNLQ